MKRMDFRWNPEKNRLLRGRYGIGFGEVVAALHGDGLLAVVPHHNPTRYPNQQLFIVNLDGYAWVVPFVCDDEVAFLKTMYPSRLHTERFLGERTDD